MAGYVDLNLKGGVASNRAADYNFLSEFTGGGDSAGSGITQNFALDGGSAGGGILQTLLSKVPKPVIYVAVAIGLLFVLWKTYKHFK